MQLGVVGYDPWQTARNEGSYIVAGLSVPASAVPRYSAHANGFQANYILPAKDFLAYFKYYNEYLAFSRPQGRTFAFGFSWTRRISKA
jgi:hypothetical protein